MATGISNSTMEMGTSDQVLVAAKRKKTLTYVFGGAAMLITIGIVVTLVVLLSGNEGGVAERILQPPTKGPNTIPSITTRTTTTTTTKKAPKPTDGSTTIPSTTTTTEAPTEGPTTIPSTSTTTEAPKDGANTILSTTTTKTTKNTNTEALTDGQRETPETLPPEDQIELQDVINGMYSAAGFNGSWASASEVLFRNANGDLILYDVATDTESPLISNSSDILQLASRVTQLSPDGTNVVLSYNVVPVYRYSFLARYAAIDIATGAVVDIVPPGINSNEAFLQNFVWGPSGTACAFVYLNNVYFKSSLSTDAIQISTSGVLNVVYNGIPDWVYEEEVFVSNNAIWFSPDGTKLSYATFNDTSVRVMRVPHYGVPGAVEYQYTQHHEIRYPKPGTTNPTVSVTLRDLSNNDVTVYKAPDALEQPILKTVSFVRNDSVALMWTDRVQTSLLVQLCILGTMACQEIFTYTEQNGWIDNIPLIFNDDGNSFLTILPGEVEGTLFKQIVQVTEVNANMWTPQTRGLRPHTASEILLWSSDNVIWYKATGENDTREQHIYRMDGDEVICFTCDMQGEGECLYNEGNISPGGDMITINCAGPDVPVVLIYNTNGTLIKNWELNEEVSALVADRQVPEILHFEVPVADGYPPADVHIQVPSDYANMTNVPLLVYVYGGPDTALVTRQWSIDWGTSLVNRWGVAIAHIDGRGSGLRGVANMFAVNRRLGTVEIDDQINVTRHLQENLPWIDSNRTCIWGWSYGGYASSLALARGGDVFRCAIAVAPVTDWRFYDTIYTERYMDVPLNNSQAYTESSLLSDEVVAAFRNKRYFLVHGTADDNVHYQHSMLLSRLLQRRDVYFTQMSYSDEDHGLVGVRPHLYHALERFLEENML